jgi:hypothetical protein
MHLNVEHDFNNNRTVVCVVCGLVVCGLVVRGSVVCAVRNSGYSDSCAESRILQSNTTYAVKEGLEGWGEL